MSDLDLLLAIVGAAVTILVVAGMVLITPRGQVPAATDGEGSARADASPGVATAPRPAQHAASPAPALAPMAETEVRVDGVASGLRPA